jgi:tetratricopeptide (TPR) repeat protein
MPGLLVTPRCRRLALVVALVGVLAACGRPDVGVLAGPPVVDVAASFDGRHVVAVPFDATAGRRYVARLEQIDTDAELALFDGERALARVASPARSLGAEYLAFTAPDDPRLRFEIRNSGTPGRSAGFRLRVHALPADAPAEVAAAFERWTRAGGTVASPDAAGVLADLEAVERAWAARDATLAADVHMQIAAVQYWQQDDWRAAIRSAELAASAYARAEDDVARADATVLAALARLEVAREQRGTNRTRSDVQFSTAERELASARRAYTAAGRPIAAAMTWVYAGSGRYYDYDLAGAVDDFARGEQALAAAGAEDERRVVLGNLATASADRGDYAGAARDYDRLLPLLAGRRDELLAATLQNSASTLLFLGEPERALARYVEALAVADERGLDRVRTAARIGLGTSHLQLGQPDLAVAHLEAALAMLGEADRHTRVLALLRLGDAHRQLGRAAAADAVQAEAAIVAAALGAPALRARVAVAQGDGHAAAGLLARAVDSYDAALSFEVAETHGIVARALVGRGRALRLLDRVPAAGEDLDRAAALAAANGNRETLIAADYERAELALRTGDRDAALVFARRAADGTRALTAAMTNPDNRVTLGVRLRAAQDLVVDLLASDALRLAAADDPRAAESASLAALLATEAALPPLARGAPAPAAVAERQRVASTLAERRYRLESLAERYDTATPTMLAIEREIAALRSQLSALGDPADSMPPAAPAPQVDAPTLRARVPDGSVLLVYSLGKDRGWRWTIGRDRFELEALPGSAVVDRQVATLLDAVQAIHAPPRAEAAGRALAVQVLPHGLPPRTRLLVVPDGSLGAVPWALLGAPGAHATLQLASLTAVTAADATPWPTTGLRLALFGDPIFGVDDPRVATGLRPAARAADPRALPRLPGTARELEAIAALAPAGSVRRATGADATRVALLGLPRDGVDVLHLATHATLDTQVPALAAVVLSRRDATGRELRGDVRSADVLALAAHPRLVVLSACDTAAEPSRSAAGLMNLTRAFLAGGTRYVVASRWAVGDASAVALMTEFYRGLLQDGLPPDVALERAQRLLAASAQWHAPFHWAGFVVTGAAP